MLLFQGDYNQYECGLTVAAATAEDNGEWECEFESYVKVGEDFLEYFESYVKVGILCWNEPVYIFFGILHLSSLLREDRGGVDTKLLRNSELSLRCPLLQPPQRSQH